LAAPTEKPIEVQIKEQNKGRARAPRIWRVGFLLAALLLWPLYQGKLWIIDDHEIVFFSSIFDKSGGSFIRPFASALSETEVFRWGQSGRYRPAYYFARVLKTYLFGTSARAWFLCNFFVFFLSAVCVGISLRPFFPSPFVFLGMLVFAALPCYADMWGRLGPSEIGACFWTALFACGAARWLERRRFALMCFAVFMAAGYKENFALLLLPLSAFLVNARKEEGAEGRFFLFLFPMGMAFAVWGSVAFWVSGLPRSVDIYGQPLSMLVRIGTLLNFFRDGPRAGIAGMGFLLFYACRCLAKVHGAKNSFIAMLVLAACVLGNFIFHNGATSLLSRYAFMEQFFLAALFFIALFPLRWTLLKAWETNAAFRRSALRWCRALGVVSLLSILALSGVNAFRVRRTLEFDYFLNQVKHYENVQVVNLGRPLSSYEPYFSLKRHAEAGVIPKVYYFPFWAPAGDAFSSELKNSLLQDAEVNPAPPLTAGTALVEFSGANGWFRLIEHTSPYREIEQTLLMSGWQEEKGGLEKFFGLSPLSKGRRTSGGALALAVDEPRACEIIVSAFPFGADNRQSDAIFYVNGKEVKRAKQHEGEFRLTISQDLALRSPLHKNLMQLEVRIENSDPTRPNGLVFHSIDILPLP
jgi:hypothetical protein